MSGFNGKVNRAAYLQNLPRTWIIADDHVRPGEVRYLFGSRDIPSRVTLRDWDRKVILRTVHIAPNRGGMWQVSPTDFLALTGSLVPGDRAVAWEPKRGFWS